MPDRSAKRNKLSEKERARSHLLHHVESRVTVCSQDDLGVSVSQKKHTMSGPRLFGVRAPAKGPCQRHLRDPYAWSWSIGPDTERFASHPSPHTHEYIRNFIGKLFFALGLKWSLSTPGEG